jgi:UDP-2,3-diacylglucosamine hydrolase
MNAGRDPQQGRLAIIAGGGLLPLYVARAANAAGENPFIIALKGESSADWSGFQSATLSIGDFSRMAALFKDNGIGRVVLTGSVVRRPEWREIRPTLRFLSRVPFALRTLTGGGDNAVLEMVIGLIEALGCRVVGAHEVVPDLLAKSGAIGRASPDAEAQKDIAAAVHAALALGRLDIGQGAVAVGGRVVALEGPEGTDLMLERIGTLRSLGRISKRRKGVLVKLAKPQQDERADLPAIGLATLENAARAGLSGIVAEAGRSLLLDREKLIRRADEIGLFVLGIEPSEEAMPQ